MDDGEFSAGDGSGGWGWGGGCSIAVAAWQRSTAAMVYGKAMVRGGCQSTVVVVGGGGDW